MTEDRDHGGGRVSNPYCRACTNREGTLLSYEAVLQQLVKEEYVGRNGMDPQAAEVAARNALSRQPAWRGRA